MQKSDSAGNKPNDLEERDVRALTEYLTVIPVDGGIYSVTSQSGSEYRVDIRKGRCTCPDHEYRGVRCKHIRRVAFETGETPIPSWVDPSAIPDDFARHVEDAPRVAATDGSGELHDDDTGDDSCLCDRHDDLGCFEHFEVSDDDTPMRSEPADFGGGETTGVQDL